jgi:hypothetical protein
MKVIKKVEIISCCSVLALEREINNFIKTRYVRDIQYQMSGNPYRGAVYSAMIIYEDKEE